MGEDGCIYFVKDNVTRDRKRNRKKTKKEGSE